MLDDTAREYLRAVRAGVPAEGLTLPATLEPKAAPACATCNDLGFIRRDVPIGDPAFGQAQPCPNCGAKLDPAAYLAELARKSQLTGRERAFTLAGFRTNTLARVRAKAEVEKLLTRGVGWLTLWGGNGNGKSYLAAALVNAAVERRMEARYWTLADMLDALRIAYNPEKGEADYASLAEDLAAVRVLVVDECQMFSPTPWALEKLNQIKEARYRHAEDGISVWISNVDPHEAAGPLDPLFSRMTQFTTVKLDDGDVRPQLGRDYRDS